jgi:hypothetical protein
MSSASDLLEYRKAIDAAVEAHERASSTSDFEFLAAQLLDLLSASTDVRDYAERDICSGLTSGRISHELVGFLMHELRWESVRNAAQKLLDEAADPRIRRPMEFVLDSFGDDWEDAALFDRYRK